MQDITVVKCGGNAAVDPLAICSDVAGMAGDGERVVLVHGGSADIDALAGRLGVPMRRLVSPDGVSARYTDAAALEVVHLALAGLAKPRLVGALVAAGVPAVGLTGLDGGLLRAKRKSVHRALVDGRRVLVRDDHSGRQPGEAGRDLDGQAAWAAPRTWPTPAPSSPPRSPPGSPATTWWWTAG